MKTYKITYRFRNNTGAKVRILSIKAKNKKQATNIAYTMIGRDNYTIVTCLPYVSGLY